MTKAQLVTEVFAGLMVPDEGRANDLEIALSLNSPEHWDLVWGNEIGTASGVRVTAKKALGVAPLWQAINLIAGDTGALPLCPYRRKEDGFADRDERHWTYSLVRWQANEHETAQEYWETLTAQALLYGNGYGLILRDGSYRPSELLHLLPDRTGPEYTPDGRLYYVSEIEGKLVPFMPEDILHLRGVSYANHEAPEFLTIAKESIANAIAAQKFQSKFFKHGGRVGGVLELPLGIPKLARDTIEEGFRKSYEGEDNPFKTVILRDSAKFHQAQVSPRDTQMIESREQNAREIARFFKIPPSMLGLNDAGSINSKAEDSTGYLTHCLRPWLLKISGQCWLRMLTPSDQRRYEFRHDTDEMLRMDLASRAQAYQVAIQSRWMNPNEVRAREGLPPYNGGDEFENPNTTPGGRPKTEDEPEPPQGKPAPTDPAGEAARARLLFAITAAARFKADNPNAFIKWLDGGFHSQLQNYGGEAPPFVVAIRTELDKAAAAVTATALPQNVETICTTFEKEWNSWIA